MIKTKIRENIYQYEFIEDENNPIYGVNIIVIEDNNRALIIDAAYQPQARELKKDLESRSISVDTIILSHYHPDHTVGCSEFEAKNIIASKFYHTNLENCKGWHPECKFLEPNLFAQNLGSLKYGNHDIRFIHAPGHCECGIITVIDEKIAQVGDLIMATRDGRKMLPYVCPTGSFEEHIDSLNKLLDLNLDTLLLAHGDMIEGKDAIKEAVEDRLYYLTKVKDSQGQLELEECLITDISDYSVLSLHKKNKAAL